MSQTSPFEFSETQSWFIMASTLAKNTQFPLKTVSKYLYIIV